MKRTYLFALIILSTAIAVAACGKKVPPAASAGAPPSNVVAPPPPPSRAGGSGAGSTGTALSDEDLFAQKTLDQLNAERPLADVHFALDEWTIGDEGRVILQKNADWLRRWSTTRITIEGHCDDRGTGEYNLALGERRAHAVREYLGSLGITPDRVLVVSRGEESPVCAESTEDCWQQNRRGHPVITAK